MNCTDCTFGKVDPKCTMFDVEYLFLQMRSKSVGETVEVKCHCPDDGKTRVSEKINIEDIGVQMSVDHTNEIHLTDDIKIIFRYPSVI